MTPARTAFELRVKRAHIERRERAKLRRLWAEIQIWRGIAILGIAAWVAFLIFRGVRGV